MRPILSLIIAASFLSLLIPHADAARINSKSANLRPHFLKPSRLRSQIRAIPVSPVIKAPQAANVSAGSGAQLQIGGSNGSAGASIFTNSGVITTGAGTLNLGGNFGGATMTFNPGNGTITGSVSQTTGSVSISGAPPTVGVVFPPLVPTGGTVTVNPTAGTNGGTLSILGEESNRLIIGGGTLTWGNSTSGVMTGGSITLGTGTINTTSGITTDADSLGLRVGILHVGGQVFTGLIQSGVQGFWVDPDHDGIFEPVTLGISAENGTISILSGASSNGVTVQNASVSDFSTEQTLSSLVIGDGAVITLDGISTPPMPAPEITASVAPVPEPASSFLLAIGALAANATRRRREN